MNFALREDFRNRVKIFFIIFYKSVYIVFIFMKLSIWIEALDTAFARYPTGQISGYNLAAGYRISSYFS